VSWNVALVECFFFI